MVDVCRLPVGEDNEMRVTLDDLAREGALRMIAAALEAEVEQYVASFVDERDEDGNLKRDDRGNLTRRPGGMREEAWFE